MMRGPAPRKLDVSGSRIWYSWCSFDERENGQDGDSWRDPGVRSQRKRKKEKGKEEGGGREKESITRVRCEFSAIRIYRDGNGRVQYRSPETNRSLESHTVCITDIGVSFGGD